MVEYSRRGIVITYLAVVGLLLGGLSFRHVVEPGEPLVGKILSVAALLFIAVPLLGSAYWLNTRKVDDDHVWRVAMWSAAGLLSLTFFALIVVLYEQSHGVHLAHTGVITLFVGGTGATAGVIIGLYDLRLIRAHDRYRTSTERLRSIFETSPIALIELTPEGTIERWNSAAERISGWSSAEVMEKPLSMIVSPREECLDWQAAHRSERPISGVETQFTAKDGSVVKCRLWATPVKFHSDRDSGTLVALVDITEETHRRQKLRVVNRILRHNLRNAVNIILGRSNLLLEEHAEDKARQDLDSIRHAAERLCRLSDHARNLQRAMASEAAVSGPVDITEILEDTVDALRNEYPEARFSISAPDSALVAAGSSIELALREVIENGIEHTDDSPARIDIHVSDCGAANGGGTVLVTIDDNGPGIPEHELAVLENGHETQLEHSSGLGLWLIKWITNHNGGMVSIHENSSAGTSVEIRLPTAPTPNEFESDTPDQRKQA